MTPMDVLRIAYHNPQGQVGYAGQVPNGPPSPEKDSWPSIRTCLENGWLSIAYVYEVEYGPQKGQVRRIYDLTSVGRRKFLSGEGKMLEPGQPYSI